jgi:hypothetical protein
MKKVGYYIYPSLYKLDPVGLGNPTYCISHLKVRRLVGQVS